jgi:hypothetical protein
MCDTGYMGDHTREEAELARAVLEEGASVAATSPLVAYSLAAARLCEAAVSLPEARARIGELVALA